MALSSLSDRHIPSLVEAPSSQGSLSSHDQPSQHTQLCATESGLQAVNDISMTGLCFDYNLRDGCSAPELLQLSNHMPEIWDLGEYNSWSDL